MRHNAARLAYSRPLYEEKAKKINGDPTDINSIQNKWNFIENVDARDMFLMSFFKRYGQIIYEHIDRPKLRKNNQMEALGHYLKKKVIAELGFT
jgi:hypothetical protein